MNGSFQKDDVDPRLSFLHGGGQMGSLIREFNWEPTGLGDPKHWPFSLRTAVGIMLNSAAPMYIAWGSRYVQLYNDAYAPILGELKHPQALGLTTPETWQEIWDFVGPLFAGVMSTGQAVSMENKMFPMLRNGYLEECYFNFSYSPLIDELGNINGIISSCWETTERIISTRRSHNIRSLVEGLAQAANIEDVRAVFEAIVQDCPEDLPFGLWYELRRDRSGLELMAGAGITIGSTLSPHFLNPRVDAFYADAVDLDTPVVADLSIHTEVVKWARADVPIATVQTLAIKPLCYTDFLHPDAYLMVAVNPLRPNDEAQKQFLKEVRAQIENAVRRVIRNEWERRESQHQYHVVMNAVPCLVWMSDLENECSFFNDAWLAFRGRTYEQEINSGWKQGIHPDDLGEVTAQFQIAFEGRTEYTDEYRLRRADGIYRWILDRSTPRFDIEGDFLGYIGTCLDITEHKSAETALTASEARYKHIVETAQEGIWVFDGAGRTTFVNPKLEEMLGHSRGEMIGHVVYDFMDNAARQEAESYIKRRKPGIAHQHELKLTKKDGSVLWVLVSSNPFVMPDERSAGALAMLTDITDRKKNEQRIEYLATHDALTDLPNRNLLKDRITQAIAHAQRTGPGLGVIFIDLDHFKYVNDSYGHAVGDEVLKVVAQELCKTVRQGDTVARLGGDEFVILLPEIESGYVEGSVLVNHILSMFQQPLKVANLDFRLTASIGICFYPNDGQTADELLMYADTSMYRAKEAGRNGFQFYEAEMSNRAKARSELESALRQALSLNQFELYYQPQVEILGGQTIGMEALIRWRHPEMGMIPTAQFIPVAEETGQIVAIGEWVLRNACAQNMAWQTAGLPHLTVAVNLSAVQLRQSGFVAMVSRVLHETGLAPHCLELELTESMLMGKSDYVKSTLTQLDALGISLSMDDFGTGYSNLGYIQSFPLRQLKIDKSFLQHVPENKDSAAITTAIVSMGQSLELRIIAEGVESVAQANFWTSISCKYAQGFLYSPALSADAFEMWIRGANATLS
jgi:diguanylate cyclase (GGDEF)-like protein/PAS domain S-box-containing protein